MKILANSIKSGNIIIYEDDLWIIIKNPEHTKPGKGPAYIQLEMKNLKNNTKVNKRFAASDSIEKVDLNEVECQYLYTEDNNLVFMNTKTFEQIYVSKEIIRDKLSFFDEEIVVKIKFYYETPIRIVLPHTIVSEITSTEPVIKGATVNPGYKSALLKNGLTILVPSYLMTGEKVEFKTDDLSFVGRVK